MKILFYLLALVFFISSCDDESVRVAPYALLLEPHSSNEEFYAGVPVTFGIKPRVGGNPFISYVIDLYVGGNKVDLKYNEYSFTQPGTYTLKAFVKTNTRTYELDTVINIINGPPIFGSPQRGERALFGWKAGTSFKALLGTYYGSSALDYEVLSIDESLQQQGALTTLNLDWYPEFRDHDVSSSGMLALIYDNKLAVYDEALQLKHQIFFNYGRTPRKILVTENKAALIFDSLNYVTLKQVDLTSGKIVKGPTQFIGVDGMTLYNHFFLDESRIAAYYVDPSNSKTLLMGVQVGADVEFSQYFQPPVFIENVMSISSSGYIFTTPVSSENKITVLGADNSNVVKWTRTFDSNFLNYWNQIQGRRVVLKEWNGYIYVFFDNMRCIKLSLSGQLIWDKYFYSTIARFEDMIMTSIGDFIMIGTRQLILDDIIDSQLQTDIVCIKINSEGYRLDQ